MRCSDRVTASRRNIVRPLGPILTADITAATTAISCGVSFLTACARSSSPSSLKWSDGLRSSPIGTVCPVSPAMWGRCSTGSLLTISAPARTGILGCANWCCSGIPNIFAAPESAASSMHKTGLSVASVHWQMCSCPWAQSAGWP